MLYKIRSKVIAIDNQKRVSEQEKEITQTGVKKEYRMSMNINKYQMV